MVSSEYTSGPRMMEFELKNFFARLPLFWVGAFVGCFIFDRLNVIAFCDYGGDISFL